jgi:two-component system response regulator PilR (NtrC family)
MADLHLPAQQTPGGTHSEPGVGLPHISSAVGEHLPDALEQIERASIEKALIANRYNKTKAAAQLGITFRALRYKLKKLGME